MYKKNDDNPEKYLETNSENDWLIIIALFFGMALLVGGALVPYLTGK
ncbi:MAG: hypothetical protein P4L62_04450 [Candidatus Pacebacteria bacterium]|nr:hypothetical protein [Candidatus Paceibacterota bacterium]MDR3583582.1 hypothetical protein [Candidatus Paceibacterota bacterium]